MTDRIRGFVVTLDKDIREDDVEVILNAVRMIKHVQSVEPHVTDINTIMAESRAKQELTGKIFDVLTDFKFEE